MPNFDPADVADIIARLGLKDSAKVFEGGTQRPFAFQIITFTLAYGVAKSDNDPQKIGINFKSLYVMSCSHPALKIKFRPNSRDSYQSAIELSEKDVLNFDYQLAEGYIHWDAQSVSTSSSVAQTVTCLFLVDGNFKSGALSSIKGGVKTDMYNGASIFNLTLSAATVSNLSDPPAISQVPSYASGRTDRSVLVQNQTGGVLYVGPDVAVDDGSGGGGIHKGYMLQDGDSYKWNNKSQLYGWSAAGGNVNVTAEY